MMNEKATATPTPTPKPRVSPLGTQARDAQRKAAAKAQEDKIWNQMQKQARDNHGNGSY